MEAAALLLLSPLDRARSLVLRALGRWLGPWMRSRELRVAWLGAWMITLALAGTLFLPTWMLALGPIVLGVPHIAADLRYLVARPGLHARGWSTWAVLVPLAAGAVTGRLYYGLGAAAVAVAVSRAAWLPKLAGLALTSGLALLSYRYRGWSELVFAHGHNLVAVLLWWAWRPRTGRGHLVPLGLFFGFGFALLAGWFDPIFAAVGQAAPTVGAPLRWHAYQLAPFAEPEIATRWVLAFAFAQSVHYTIWLRLVPEEDREREGPRGFASSYRALVADLGKPIVWATALGTLGLAIWAAFDLVAARSGYLRFAVFHGQLELCAGAWLLLEGRLGRAAHLRGGSVA
jgi:hypothetical protein